MVLLLALLSVSFAGESLRWEEVQAKLKQSEGWDASTLRKASIFLNTRAGAKADVLVSSERDCGVGTCRYHLYEELPGKVFRELGVLEGHPRRDEKTSHGRHDLIVTTRNGT